MEDIKVILCDLDGTLIDTNNKFVSANIKGIEYARSKGIAFGIATGRPDCIVPKNLKNWGLDKYCDYVVCSNGSQVIDNIAHTTIKQHYLSKDIIYQIIDRYQDDPDLTVCIYSDDGIYQVGNRVTQAYVNKCTTFGLQQKIVDLKQYIDHDYSKVLLLSEHDKQEKIMADFKENPSDLYSLMPSSKFITEIVTPGLHKVKGIEKICEVLNINHNQVMCFGDEMNDYEMLKQFVGVAMGNAIQPIKDICKYHTIDCKDGGVGDFILKNL